MDSEREEKILTTCENIATYYINSILELKVPEILDDFPEYPKDVPDELLFAPPKKVNEAAAKKNKKPRIKKEKVEKLDVDELNSSVSKRRCRYSGTYDVEKQLSILLDDTSEPENNNSIKVEDTESKNSHNLENDIKLVPKDLFKISGVLDLSREPSEVEINNNTNEHDHNLQNFQTFIIKNGKLRKPRIKTLSDSSSDEEDETTRRLNLSLKYPICLIERYDPQASISNKSQGSPEKQKPLNGLNKNKQKPLNEVNKNFQIPKPVVVEPQKEQDCKALKLIFKNSTSFDDAMQKYTEKKKELGKIGPPKIIPAPEQDPTIKKITKKKPIKANGNMTNESNPNKHLGGIFTINNGWDKQDNKKIEEENENKKENANKLERHITPPNIVIDTNIEDVMAAHDEFMYNDDLMDNLLTSKDSTASFSSASSHSLQIALSGDKISENNSFKGRKINSSLNSSEDESENEDIIKPFRKVQRLSYSDDENENEVKTKEENSNKNHGDTDVVSLFAEAGEFDDLEDEKDQLYAEIDPDDLKLKVQCVKRKIDPLDHQTEFDLNTKEISQHMADPETDKILKTIFGNVCPAFLESRCTIPECQRNHFLLDESRVLSMLFDATFDVLRKVFQVVLKYHRLFQAYVSVLVHICIKNKDDIGLAELVKACDRLPRTIPCYKDIVRKLVELDYMKEHRAISFIIAHHADSEIARDTILSLILDSGPCIAFFMDFIEKAHMKQPIRSDMFGRILHTCVAYQNPKLPNFCLNYLQGSSANQMKNLNSEHLKAFLQMNKCISELNENREAKALKITQKLLSSMDW
ncbi:GATOR2 complex protein WDR24-like [Chironomus tepperi]|uniref:GATOR2 complex protein WDR24-like n=1 Tax=Chironomus tepperi TaxID=113505 RepID=UPI00391F1545